MTRNKPKLRGRLASLASEKIAEEVGSRRYPTRAQAVAVGISRARAELKKKRARVTKK